MAVPFSSLLKKQKKLKKGVKTALTQLKSQESILEGPEGLTEQKEEALASFIPKIGYYDTKTGEGSGLVGEIGSAGGAFSQAHKSYKESESVFAETKSGKAMASFKEKYKTYDPQAAQNYSKELTGEMKANENWGAYQKSIEWRNRLDTQLKKHGWNPEDFYISKNEKGEITRHGVGVKNPQGWLISRDDKVGGRNVWQVMYEHSVYKDYFSVGEGKISEADTEFRSQSDIAYGPRNVRRAGPTEYQQFLDKSSGFKSTMETQSGLIKTKSTELGIDPETGSKTGSGVYGEMSEVESEWDTKIGKQEKEISEIYKPAHTGAKTALTALTARIKKYELLGLADQEPKKSPTYRKPQMGYGAGYLRRSA